MFFKWIKQNLKIKRFLGTSKNAVLTQIWIEDTKEKNRRVTRFAAAPTPPGRFSKSGQVICYKNRTSLLANYRFALWSTVAACLLQAGMNAKRLLQFLQQLIRTSGHKIFLILDNLRVHHARLVKAWLADKRNTARAEVFFLPACCLPEQAGRRISELRFEGGSAFQAAGQRRQSIGKEDTLTHEDFAEITRPDTKILQTSQDRLCRLTCNVFNCRVNRSPGTVSRELRRNSGLKGYRLRQTCLLKQVLMRPGNGAATKTPTV